MTAEEPLPLGEPVAWRGARRPAHRPLQGRHVLLRAPDAASDAGPLYKVSHPPLGDPAIWTYLFDGPYPSVEALRRRPSGA